MTAVASPILLADLFDRLRLQLPDPIVNWLTPVWILCVGAAVGLVLTAAIWGIFWLLSRIPAIGTLAENTTQKRLAIAALTVVFTLLFAGVYMRASAQIRANQPPVAAGEAAASVQQGLDQAWGLAGCLAAGFIFATGSVILSSRKALAET